MHEIGRSLESKRCRFNPFEPTYRNFVPTVCTFLYYQHDSAGEARGCREGWVSAVGSKRRNVVNLNLKNKAVD
jgi:hypothetical protein